MSDHRTVEWAIDIIGMCEPIRCHQGGMWFGRNQNFADATFVDYSAADAFAVAAKVLPTLVDALSRIAGHDRHNPGLHYDSIEQALDSAVFIAQQALDLVGSPRGQS